MSVIDLATGNLPARARGPASEALALVRTGWPLVPMRPRSKEPYHELLPQVGGKPSWHAFTLRPASEVELLSWFEHDPECGIAAIMGQASGGLVCVDVDHSDKLPPGRPLPATLSSTSSDRGDGHWRGHLFFRAESPVAKQRYDWGEVLGEGCLVILPPSLHPSGDRYVWTPTLGPGEVVIASAPEWIYSDAVRRPVRQSDAIAVSQALVTGNDAEGCGSGSDRLLEPSGSGKCSEKKYTPLATLPASILTSLATNPEAALTIVRLCGARVTAIGRGFRCILPEHDERRPSAALFQQRDGTIRYHDFHAREDGEWLSLGEVYAARVTGKVQTLSAGERAVWHLRAAVDGRLLQPPVIAAPPLPHDAPQSVRKYYDGFRRLLAIRALYDATQNAAPFSWRFAASWCGIASPSTIQKSAAWLLARGYLQRVPQAREPAEDSTAGRRPIAVFALGRPKAGR